jgi:uncharacterized cupin superfamily protein
MARGTMENRRHPNVVNLSEVEPRQTTKGSRFAATSKSLAAAAGGRGVGASWYEVPPGKTAFPAHWHSANEEAVFILEGEGTLRIGDQEIPVRANDWVTLRTGPEHAHQLVNTGSAPLRYLAFSTLLTTEVVGYPDSRKVGVRSGANAEEMYAKPWVRVIVKEGASVDYYEGEKVD